jgi:hypothetical protein
VFGNKELMKIFEIGNNELMEIFEVGNKELMEMFEAILMAWQEHWDRNFECSFGHEKTPEVFVLSFVVRGLEVGRSSVVGAFSARMIWETCTSEEAKNRTERLLQQEDGDEAERRERKRRNRSSKRRR